MVEGLFVKRQETKYGEIIKLNFDLRAFYEFAKANKTVSEKNGKEYLTIDILTSKEGKKYPKLNDFKPEPQDDLPF